MFALGSDFWKIVKGSQKNGLWNGKFWLILHTIWVQIFGKL